MPLRDLSCNECGHAWEELLRNGEKPTCPRCGAKKVSKLPPLIGGYTGDLGSASVKPRQAGSFKKKDKK